MHRISANIPYISSFNLIVPVGLKLVVNML